jgi:hypothetical protein
MGVTPFREKHMDQTQFHAANECVNEIAEQLDDILDSPELAKVREVLAALAKRLGEPYTVSLTCLVEVFDSDQGRSLPLLTTGVLASESQEPSRFSNDSTYERYLVDGEIRVVPHDRCPSCWCSHCHLELGENCKVLLDSDVCPHCEKGKVTASKPQCSKCGFQVDPSFAAWG